jgi:hypothetical protein
VLTLQTKSILSYSYSLICIVAFIALVQKGGWVQADTSGYEANLPIRSMLYPLLLDLYHIIFSIDGDFAYTPLVMLQVAFGLFAARSFSYYWVKQFSLPVAWQILVTIILMVPYFLSAKIGNAILTEALCYPLFLLFLSSLLKGLIEQNYKALIQALVYVTLLVLTRSQFVFLYPLLLLVFIYSCYVFPKSFPKRTLLVMIVGVMIFTSLAGRTYQWLLHDKFASIPFTGVHLSIAPFFIAKEQDITLFEEGSTQRKVFEMVYHDMKAKDIAAQRGYVEHPGIRSSTYSRFKNGYDEILYGSYYPALDKASVSSDWFERDDYTTNLALTLFKANIGDWFELYKKNVSAGLGGDYMSILTVLLLLFLLHSLYIKRHKELTEASLLVLLAHIGNVTSISIIQVGLYRYTFYTQGLFYLLLLTFFYILFRQKKLS